MKSLVQKLLENAELQESWDKWELGHLPVPGKLMHKDTAALLREAAKALANL